MSNTSYTSEPRLRVLSSQLAGRRRRREGMTLVEIMIVMVIMALVTAAASFAILPRLRDARVKATQQDAKKIASAAEMYMSEHDDCPTVDKLVEVKIMSKKNRTADAWDHPYTIECDEDGAVVKSAGPDGQMGTDDDIE
jgi:prepilin-type N-terminal cleavage/methylation domain-containing protein